MASDMGFQSPTPADKNMRGGIVAIDLDHPFEIEKMLRKDHRIFTSARGNFLRISPHFYNTKDDIIKFFESLKTIKHGR
jgi:selenocysteine lyase/cysteine desulfurase